MDDVSFIPLKACIVNDNVICVVILQIIIIIIIVIIIIIIIIIIIAVGRAWEQIHINKMLCYKVLSRTVQIIIPLCLYTLILDLIIVIKYNI